MAEPVTVGPDRGASSDTGTALAIRFAVYLTGGLVTLAFGVLEVASSLGQFLDCVYQNTFCPGGFSSGYDFEIAPVLGAGVFLVIVAAVLLFLARGSH